METRGRYAIVGFFTLSTILAAFAFIYGFAAGHFRGGQVMYRFIVEGSASGLSSGAPVFLNGVRIGTVKELRIADSQHIAALVNIDKDKAHFIRTDTQGSIDSQGFTGLSAINLTGTKNESPPLQAENNQLPTLYIQTGGSESITKLAQRVVEKVDDFLTAVQPGAKRMVDSIGDSANSLNKILESINHDKKLIDDLSISVRAIGSLATNLNKRTEDMDLGLREYISLARDGRKTLENLSRLLERIEKSPQQFIFGRDPMLPTYKAGR
jgi:phospholipid/cholesterol/gamma-HCH transport system substrate-binding protein